MLSDIEIAQQAKMQKITDVAAKLGISEDDIELYGRYKAKLSMDLIRRMENEKPGKLVLVTAITPTPAGEGKSTTTVGLAQGLHKIGKKVIVALREPSLGPCMGIKGGAAGGGYSQVVPMEDINLHFTGDFHAITSAHMLLSAMLDNHIQQGNALNIDPRRIVWKRVVDMNDRELRNIVVGLGGKAHGVPRQDGFDITVASEVMAILCLANSLHDLKERLSKIIVAYDYSGNPVTAGQIKAHGAMAALLKDAIKPNLVSFNVNKLVEEGYLERVPIPGNRRSIRLVCTEKAKPVVAKGRDIIQHFYLNLMKGMSEEDIARFHGSMELIGGNVMILKKSLEEGRKADV